MNHSDLHTLKGKEISLKIQAHACVYVNFHLAIPSDRQPSDENYKASFGTRHILHHLVFQMVNLNKKHPGCRMEQGPGNSIPGEKLGHACTCVRGINLARREGKGNYQALH